MCAIYYVMYLFCVVRHRTPLRDGIMWQALVGVKVLLRRSTV